MTTTSIYLIAMTACAMAVACQSSDNCDRYSYDPHNGYRCVECSKSYYMTSHNECYACAIGCDSCADAGSCSACVPGYRLTASGSCGKCIAGCESCHDDRSCDTCSVGQFKTANAECRSCNANCDYCSGENTCDTCSSIHYKTSHGSCSKCSSGCARCSNHDSCDSCNNNGYFKNELGQCSICLKNCEICESKSHCSICKSGFSLNNNQSTCDPESHRSFTRAMIVIGIIILSAIIYFYLKTAKASNEILQSDTIIRENNISEIYPISSHLTRFEQSSTSTCTDRSTR